MIGINVACVLSILSNRVLRMQPGVTVALSTSRTLFVDKYSTSYPQKAGGTDDPQPQPVVCSSIVDSYRQARRACPAWLRQHVRELGRPLATSPSLFCYPTVHKSPAQPF